MEEGEEREKEENPTPPGGQNNKPDICHISDTAKRMLARKGRTKGGRGGGVHYSVLQEAEIGEISHLCLCSEYNIIVKLRFRNVLCEFKD